MHFNVHFKFCITCLNLFHPLLQIDKDGANPDRVMQELSSIGLMAEDWGGDTPMVKVNILNMKKSFPTQPVLFSSLFHFPIFVFVLVEGY